MSKVFSKIFPQINACCFLIINFIFVSHFLFASPSDEDQQYDTYNTQGSQSFFEQDIPKESIQCMIPSSLISISATKISFLQVMEDVPVQERASIEKLILPLLNGVIDEEEKSLILWSFMGIPSENQALVSEVASHYFEGIENGYIRCALLRGFNQFETSYAIYNILQGISPELRKEVILAFLPLLPNLYTNDNVLLPAYQKYLSFDETYPLHLSDIQSFVEALTSEDIHPNERLNVLKDISPFLINFQPQLWPFVASVSRSSQSRTTAIKVIAGILGISSESQKQSQISCLLNILPAGLKMHVFDLFNESLRKAQKLASLLQLELVTSKQSNDQEEDGDSKFSSFNNSNQFSRHNKIIKNIIHFSPEIILNFFNFLSYEERVIISQVCKYFNTIIKDDLRGGESILEQTTNLIHRIKTWNDKGELFPALKFYSRALVDADERLLQAFQAYFDTYAEEDRIFDLELRYVFSNSTFELTEKEQLLLREWQPYALALRAAKALGNETAELYTTKLLAFNTAILKDTLSLKGDFVVPYCSITHQQRQLSYAEVEAEFLVFEEQFKTLEGYRAFYQGDYRKALNCLDRFGIYPITLPIQADSLNRCISLYEELGNSSLINGDCNQHFKINMKIISLYKRRLQTVRKEARRHSTFGIPGNKVLLVTLTNTHENLTEHFDMLWDFYSDAIKKASDELTFLKLESMWNEVKSAENEYFNNFKI